MQRGAPVAVPYTTFYLHSGVQLGGWLPDARTEHNRTVLLIQVSPPQPHPLRDVAYLELASVQAIVVHHADEHLALLADSTATPARPAPASTEAPPRLNLSRQMQHACTQIGERVGSPIKGAIAWEEIPDQPAARSALAQIIDALHEALLNITADQVGGTAVAEQITAITLAGGAASSATLTERHMRVALPVLAQPPITVREVQELLLDVLD